VTRKPDEPSMRVGVGMHLWEDERTPRRRAARLSGKARAAKEQGSV